MLSDIVEEIVEPQSIEDIVGNIEMPVMPEISVSSLSENGSLRNDGLKKDDIFSTSRKSWDKVNEARCDFSEHLSMRTRAGFTFVSLWQKTVFGRTLTDIKSDDSMVEFFAESIAAVISGALGDHLRDGQWCIVTTPMRRHKTHNFASMIAKDLGKRLGIPFYYDCAHCHSAHRVGAVFSHNNIPSEPNVIVFDDFITTGSTLKSMKELLVKHHKNCFLIAGINVHM